MRQIHAGLCARHIRESDANVARNKGCYFWTHLYVIFVEVERVTSANPTQMLRATRDVTFGPIYTLFLSRWTKFVN
jgi:hypothetical protein